MTTMYWIYTRQLYFVLAYGEWRVLVEMPDTCHPEDTVNLLKEPQMISLNYNLTFVSFAQTCEDACKWVEGDHGWPVGMTTDFGPHHISYKIAYRYTLIILDDRLSAGSGNSLSYRNRRGRRWHRSWGRSWRDNQGSRHGLKNTQTNTLRIRYLLGYMAPFKEDPFIGPQEFVVH